MYVSVHYSKLRNKNMKGEILLDLNQLNRLDSDSFTLNSELREITQKLDESLDMENIKVYKCYDERRYTHENLDKIWNMHYKIIENHVTQINMQNLDNNNLYELLYTSDNQAHLLEYTNIGERNHVNVNLNNLPQNVRENMFFRKVNGNYLLDRKVTEDIFQELENYKSYLYEEQIKFIRSMKKEGSTYKVVSLSDDCETWYTELINLETDERFQDVEFPHEIFHSLDIDTLLTYKNGQYHIVDGTSLYDNYPTIENYCEKNSKYATKNGYLTKEEWFDYLKNYEKSTKKPKNIIFQFFKKIKDGLKNWRAKFVKN